MALTLPRSPSHQTSAHCDQRSLGSGTGAARPGPGLTFRQLDSVPCPCHAEVTGRRRVSRQGPHDRGLPGSRLRGQVVDGPRPRPGVEGSRRRRRQRFQAHLRRPSGQEERHQGAARRARARRTSSTWPPTRTARARPSRGTCSRSSSRRCRCSRMVFHEITPTAIDEAVRAAGGTSNYGLVDAQETRRIVDRLFGYPVSELLWRKVGPGLSAGRVQSLAVRLVVERERERMAFVPPATGTSRPRFTTRPAFAATLVGSTAGGWPSGRTSTRRAGSRTTRPMRWSCSTRRAARGLAERLGRRRVHGRGGRREAVHVEAEAAVHDLHAPAGGRPEAAA